MPRYAGEMKKTKAIVIDFVGQGVEHGPYAALVYIQKFPAKEYDKAQRRKSVGTLFYGNSVRRLLDETQCFAQANCPDAEVFVAPCCLAIYQVEHQVYALCKDRKLEVPDGV